MNPLTGTASWGEYGVSDCSVFGGRATAVDVSAADGSADNAEW